MAFWNRKRDDKKHVDSAVNRLTQFISFLREDVALLRREVAELQAHKNQPVPTNGPPHAGSAVQDWLPIVDRMQELLLVQMGNADLAQAFGTYARQRELRASEEPPNTAWTEPGESTYENL
jgi:hypothetical protein